MPVTLADLLLVCGFVAAAVGLGLTFGVGPAAIVTGIVLVTAGGRMAR
jgi:hypothetical protein